MNPISRAAAAAAHAGSARSRPACMQRRLAAVCLLMIGLPVMAQTLIYRSVLPDGRVVIGDAPHPQAMSVEQQVFAAPSPDQQQRAERERERLRREREQFNQRHGERQREQARADAEARRAAAVAATRPPAADAGMTPGTVISRPGVGAGVWVPGYDGVWQGGRPPLRPQPPVVQPGVPIDPVYRTSPGVMKGRENDFVRP